MKEQAKHYYRYGTKKNCEAKWDYFKLCFSTKLKSAERADVIFVICQAFLTFYFFFFLVHVESSSRKRKRKEIGRT